MNKLTKLGASALCGSLAAVSAANAGEFDSNWWRRHVMDITEDGARHW